jgi:hypothetical protein
LGPTTLPSRRTLSARRLTHAHFAIAPHPLSPSAHPIPGTLDRDELRKLLDTLQADRPHSKPWTDEQLAKIEAKFEDRDGTRLSGDELRKVCARDALVMRHASHRSH